MTSATAHEKARASIVESLGVGGGTVKAAADDR